MPRPVSHSRSASLFNPFGHRFHHRPASESRRSKGPGPKQRVQMMAIPRQRVSRRIPRKKKSNLPKAMYRSSILFIASAARSWRMKRMKSGPASLRPLPTMPRLALNISTTCLVETPKLQKERKRKNHFQYDTRGLPYGSTTALIGDSLTQKSTLGKAFLSRCFYSFPKQLCNRWKF